MRKIAMTPVWILQIFGQTKSFVANPIIGSRTLNRLGLHAARLIAAHALRRVRITFITPFVPAAQRRAYWRDGFVAVEDFLPKEQFERLKTEINDHGRQLEVRECIQGDTLTHRVLLDDQTLIRLPVCRDVLEQRSFLRLQNFVAANFKRPLFYIQRIRNSHRKGNPDPQKNLHSDTFHPTMKAWLFLDDVPLENGPFTYVPGSHRLTWGRLKWEYNQSVNAGELGNIYSRRGSMRADGDDLKMMGLGAPTALAVRGNTLVVADTHGFHCRGPAVGQASRMEIWAYCRTNPYNPFPGTGSRWVSRLENRLAKMFWRRQDQDAAKKNRSSVWHLVPSEKMFDDPPASQDPSPRASTAG